MKLTALIAVPALALALAACGDSGDASDDATADNVELPADEAMAGAPEPMMDEGMSVDETEADAAAAAAEASAMVEDDAAVEDAIGDAEASMQ